MNKEEIVTIPFVAHESAMNRMERANRRLVIIIIVMFIGFMTYLLIPNEIIEDDIQSVEDINNSEIHQTMDK